MDELAEAEWINLGEAAEILGVHPGTVRAWADRGELPVQRTAGGHRRFRRADVEARAGSAERSQLSGAQIIIDNMLGRARFQLTEGALDNEKWYGRLDESAKSEHRLIGRKLLHLFVRYLAGDAPNNDLLADARQIGQAYEKLGRQGELSFTETTRAYLIFRQFLTQTVYDMAEASGMHGPTDWGQLHRRISELSNEVLLAMIEAHDKEKNQ